jgi:hypothetical protein
MLREEDVRKFPFPQLVPDGKRLHRQGFVELLDLSVSLFLFFLFFPLLLLFLVLSVIFEKRQHNETKSRTQDSTG